MELQNKILVDRGDVKVSSKDILGTQISTCVSVCLYHPEFKTGGITHISRSRKADITPSGKYLKTSGYHYADNAIPRLLYLLKKKYTSILDKSLEMVVAGGMNNEGPVSETLSELKKYEFKVIGHHVNQLMYRQISFDTSLGLVTVTNKMPFSKVKSTKRFKFSARIKN